MSERVYPREAMTAEGGLRTYANEPVTRVTFTAGRLAYYDDAEFVAAFRPASDLDELIAAAQTMLDVWDMGRGDPAINDAATTLRAALRRWEEG